MLGITLSTNVAGRAIERTGRYKRFPVAGLGADDRGALALLAVVAGDPSRTAVGLALALFGLGFGLVGQVLIVAVQNDVDRRAARHRDGDDQLLPRARRRGRRGRARRRVRRPRRQRRIPPT